MHLGNGAITPECVVLTCGAAAAGMAVGAAAAWRAGLTRDKLLLAAGVGSLVFAAQAINVPVWPGMSAHLVGGVLLAWMLGPGLGAWTMAIVLAIQALVLGDGGVAALGANVINMALLPAGLVAATRRFASTGEYSARSMAILGAAAAAAVPLAAGLIVIETALFRPTAELTGWMSFAAAMVGTHLWVGVLEGAMTAVLALTVGRLALPVEKRVSARPVLAWIAVGLLLAAVIVPLSSALPDGYEAAAQGSGMGWLLRQ